MQDLPQEADQEWIKRAKDYVELLHLEVMDEKVGLGGILDKIEQGAANRFHEEFNRSREEI